MVNPGSFLGSRREFLISEKAEYAAGVDGGYAADALATIQRRYFKRYPIDLPHNEEPAADFLAAVDDTQPDPEQVAPDETLDPEEYAREVKLRQDRGKLIDFRKGVQLTRWLAYQYMKDHDSDSKNSGSDDPYAVLLAQLSGTSVKKPRSKLPVNLWRKTQREEIEVEVRRRIHQAASDEGRLTLGSKHRKMAGVREKVVRELFGSLSQEEKVEWAERAKEDYDKTLVEWKNHQENGPSVSPAARQRCIENLVRFAQPILDGICKSTGWKASLIAGGPEPAHGGRLNVISIHSGTTSGDIKVNFGRSERVRYKKYFVPMYADFLRKCYTPEQCRACALPENEFEGLYAMALEEEDVNFDSVGVPDVHNVADTAPTSSTARPVDSAVLRQPGGAITQEKTPVARTRAPSLNGATALPGTAPSQPVPTGVKSTRTTIIADPTISSESQPLIPAVINSSHSGVDSTHALVDSTQTRLDPTQTCVDSDRPSVVERPPSSLQPQTVEPSEEQMSALVGMFTTEHPSRSPSADPWDIPMPHPLSRPQSVLPSPNPSPRATPPLSTTNASKRPSSPIPADKQPNKRSRTNGAMNPKATRATATQKAKAKVKTAAPRKAQASIVSTSTRSVLSPSTPCNNTEILPVTDSSPEWFKSAMKMLSAADLGVEWKILLNKWHAFETASKFQESSALKAGGRPEAVGMWIGRKRAITWRPKLVDTKAVKAYGTSHLKWWELLVGSAGDDREQLLKSGINGLLSVVASLFFWGINVKRSSHERARWLSAINEFVSCLSLRQ